MRIRKRSIMWLKPGFEDEYVRRHNEIWSEMVETLKSHGAHNYSISLDRTTNQLFAYVEIDDEGIWSDIANTEVCQRWWRYMADIMLTNPDNSPKTTELTEVFYMS